MPTLSKPTNGVNTDYANRIGLLFDAFNNGNYNFPATQVPHADANTLDDYEEGTWTPTLTFATVGNLNVVYSTRSGLYRKVGSIVHLWWILQTSTFTHTTASGNAQVTGLPFTTLAGSFSMGALQWRGITKASYTDVSADIGSSTTLALLTACGSGQASTQITAADMPTGGTVILASQTTYPV